MSTLRTNKILPRDGLPSGAYGGGIIQVRTHIKSTTVTTTANGIIELHSGTITPTSATNKILVDVRLRGHETTGNARKWFMNVGRSVGGGAQAYPFGQYFCQNRSVLSMWGGYYPVVTDSPNTTNEVKYHVNIGPWGGAAGTSFSINSMTGDSEGAGLIMILYEVSA